MTSETKSLTETELIDIDESTTWKQVRLNELSYPVGWEEFFQSQREVIDRISECLEKVSDSVWPLPMNVYRAFDLIRPNQIKVVIIGQDPYHTPNIAQGLSFSVPNGKPMNPSLRNIFKKIQQEGYQTDAKNSDLHRWANQGVFLVNTMLTVSEGKPKSHQGFGWGEFFGNLLKYLSTRSNIVYILWGSDAKLFSDHLNRVNNKVIKGGHPSPTNRTNSFWDSDYFKPCNQYLKSKGLAEINWG